MGQQEVYELLKHRRLSGDSRYFSVVDIRKMVIDSRSDTSSVETVSKSLNRLWCWGLLERKNHTYRFRKGVLEQGNL